jgi:hypothetical protein
VFVRVRAVVLPGGREVDVTSEFTILDITDASTSRSKGSPTGSRVIDAEFRDKK